MRTFLKGLALLAAITSVTWIAVIWHWQSTHRDMSAEDLVVYLVLLPLVLFALVLALRWAVRGAVARQVSAAPAAASAGGTPAATNDAGPPSTESRERALAWPLMGAWVAGPAGDDVAGLLEAARSGKPGPAPDPALRDGQGLPVMCARAASIDTRAVDQAWGDWSRGPKDGEPISAPRAHVMRALAALAQVLASAREKTSEWWEGLEEEQRRSAPRVRVLASWPESWVEGERAWARHWLMSQRPALDGDELGIERWLVQQLPPGSGPEAWQHADRLLLALERERSEDLVLLTACHSDLSDSAIDALERASLLFNADRHPKGRMPGEGAAALLLRRSGMPREGAQFDALAWLHRPACIRREKSIDAAGRTSADIAREAAATAMKVAAVEPADLLALCSDAERHSPRATELFGTTIELLPALDPVEDMRLLGVVQGHAAATGALWAVAGAAAQAREAQRPALALSLADAHWRMAMVVRHEPPPSPVQRATA
jgi:hypothetical protein